MKTLDSSVSAYGPGGLPSVIRRLGSHPLVPHTPVPQPLKHMRYPQAMADTICIAAICEHLQGKHCVILCSDKRTEIEGIAVGEVRYKARLLSSEFVAMFSGNVPKAKEWMDRYAYHLRRNARDITEENVLDELRKPFDAQNRADISQYISSSIGMSYDVFEKLSPEQQRVALDGFEKRAVDLIIVWLNALRGPRLFLANVYEVVEAFDFFCIGCGWPAARASLSTRKYNVNNSLQECMYHVYEAKKNSEAIPGVGEETYLTVIEIERTAQKALYHPFSPLSLAMLEKQYRTFGPRKYSAEECPGLDLRSLGIVQQPKQLGDGPDVSGDVGLHGGSDT